MTYKLLSMTKIGITLQRYLQWKIELILGIGLMRPNTSDNILYVKVNNFMPLW